LKNPNKATEATETTETNKHTTQSHHIIQTTENGRHTPNQPNPTKSNPTHLNESSTTQPKPKKATNHTKKPSNQKNNTNQLT
jgi:hypothetical protein